MIIQGLLRREQEIAMANANTNNVMIQLVGDCEYRIRCGGDFSQPSPLGEGVEWKAPNGKLYLAMCDVEGGADEGEGIETEFEHYVYEARPVADADVEEVEGEGDEGEGDEGDEGEAETVVE